MFQPSELEGCVLGLVHSRGPLTAYAIRREFLDSPSPHWSGSAGAIYPLLRRLEGKGLVRSEAHATGARRSRRYRISGDGKRVLKAWLGPPIPVSVTAVPADALRTRLGFLDTLSPGKRREFLDQASRQLEAHRRVVERDCRRTRGGSNRLAWLVARGALAVIRARQAWLKEVAEEIG